MFYTQLVDIAEGFATAPELPGSPLLPDPRPPPGTGQAPAAGEVQTRETGVAPGPNQAVESVHCTTPKSRPPVPVGHQAASQPPPQEPKKELPEGGEPKEEIEKAEEKTASASSQSKKETVTEEAEKEAKSRSKDRKRRRSRSSKSKHRERKRSKKSPSSPSRKEKRTRPGDKRPQTPPRREDSLSRKNWIEVNKESESPERKRRDRHRDRETSRDRGRLPRPPSVPPPRWQGPIRAFQREEPHWVDTGYWPKSKGVKRREKNRAYRQANQAPRWEDRHSERQRRR